MKTVYAQHEVWYGETPDDGILAKFYGDPELAHRAALAVNAHDELVAALKGVIPDGWADDDTMDHMPGIKQARAILAKIAEASS